jgi:cob(I)alamin adenosyltransferase
MTGLMYNHRVSKTDPRIEACGTVDELNAALGLARVSARSEPLRAKLLQIQNELIHLMGEIVVLKDDLDRYNRDGFTRITETNVVPLEQWIRETEAKKLSYKGWATPGANAEAAALDMARTIARRAERRVQALIEAGELSNRQLQIYLNRVSDLLWLTAREAENEG